MEFALKKKITFELMDTRAHCLLYWQWLKRRMCVVRQIFQHKIRADYFVPLGIFETSEMSCFKSELSMIHGRFQSNDIQIWRKLRKRLTRSRHSSSQASKQPCLTHNLHLSEHTKAEKVFFLHQQDDSHSWNKKADTKISHLSRSLSSCGKHRTRKNINWQ